MWEELEFIIALVASGVAIGLMYSLIALGFVLVYKATEAINFAQGEFVMLAGYVVAAGLAISGMPVIGAIVGTVMVMIAFGFGLERTVLRPLLGRPIVAVIMATIGLGAIIRGVLPLIFGPEPQALSLPVGDEPVVLGPAVIPQLQVVGVVVTLVLFAAFTWFFRKSRMGVAMRAVADNQQVAMAMGINVERYFALAWAMAGIVAAVSGVVWGGMLGIHSQLQVVGLKVFPVVILGGLDSIPGAIIGGLIIGIGEKIGEFYWGPLVGGGIETWLAYVIALLFLLYRPQGLFGEKIIERI